MTHPILSNRINHKISPGLQIIERITNTRDELLQVVNYNAINYQYVVAGERAQLRTLDTVLTALHRNFPQGIVLYILFVLRPPLSLLSSWSYSFDLLSNFRNGTIG